MTFSMVLSTEDRGDQTLVHLVQMLSLAGVFTSPYLASFAVVDTGAESLQYIYDAFADIDRGIYIATGMRSSEANKIFALQLGARLARKTIGVRETPRVFYLDDTIAYVPSRLLERAVEGRSTPGLILTAEGAETYSVGLLT